MVTSITDATEFPAISIQDFHPLRKNQFGPQHMNLPMTRIHIGDPTVKASSVVHFKTRMEPSVWQIQIHRALSSIIWALIANQIKLSEVMLFAIAYTHFRINFRTSSPSGLKTW